MLALKQFKSAYMCISFLMLVLFFFLVLNMPPVAIKIAHHPRAQRTLEIIHF